MERIPVAGPWITAKEIDYVTDAVTNAWYGNANVYNARFEQAFAGYVGHAFATSLPSCTSALHLSLLALGVGPGDEVIVPDATWIASSAPVSYVGATPVFADVDPRSWCLDADSLEENITLRTRAAIVVDLYGSMPEMDRILAVAERHGIAVIEDAAEAVGSEYRGGRAGSFGVTGTFSFHGSKTLTTGEGGMLVTSDPGIYERCLFLRDHGRPPGDRMFWNSEVAYKYKMSSMQAALGLAQLERIEELVARKREIFSWYAEALAGIPGLTLNYEQPWVRNSYWMVTVLVEASYGLSKTEIMDALAREGIDSRPFFHPLSSIPAYEHLPQADTARRRNRNAYDIAARGVNLPSGFNMDLERVDRVARALRDALNLPSRQRSAQ